MWSLPCVFVCDKNLCSIRCVEGMFTLTDVNIFIDMQSGQPAEFYDFNIEQRIELYKVLRILYFNE